MYIFTEKNNKIDKLYELSVVEEVGNYDVTELIFEDVKRDTQYWSTMCYIQLNTDECLSTPAYKVMADELDYIIKNFVGIIKDFYGDRNINEVLLHKYIKKLSIKNKKYIKDITE